MRFNSKIILKFAFVMVISSIVFQQAFSQDKFTTTKDSQGNKVLTGQILMQNLANDSAFSWFYYGVNKYKPNADLIKYLTAYKDSFKVIAFITTWSPNDKKLVPQFYRTLLAAGYPVDKVPVLALDHNLKALGDEAQTYHITKSPTFIFYNNQNHEVGRIEGVLNKTMEGDIIAILDNMMGNMEKKKTP